MRVSARSRFTLSSVVLALALAAGCASPPQSSPASTVVPAQPAAATAPASVGSQAARASGAITFSLFGEPSEVAAFQVMVDGYKTSNPGVTVSMNAVPNQGEFMTKLSASFASGSPPDVFLINYRRIGQFVGTNQIDPAEDWLARSNSLKKDQFFEVPLKAFTQQGKLQCVPLNTASMAVYYNKDLFARYGVPLPTDSWKWTDFVNAARGLTRDTDGDGKVDLFGLATEVSIVRLAPFIWQHGGAIVDNDDNPTRIALDDQKTREAFTFFAELSTRHAVVPDAAESKTQDPDSRFIAGKAAMTLNSRRIVPELRTIKDFSWDVAAPPSDAQRASVLHSDAFCIAAASTHKAVAWDFVEYAAGVEGQQTLAQLGRTVPSLKSVANSPVFLDPAQAPSNSKILLDLADQIRLLPKLAEWPAMERVINEELERAFYGTAPVGEALDAANKRANELLRR